MKTVSKFILSFSVYIFLFLNSAFSQSVGGSGNVGNTFRPVGQVIGGFTENVVKTLTTMFGAMAFTAFMYGIFIYIKNKATDSEAAKKGSEFMIWSVVALFVLISVWGIVKLAQSFTATGGQSSYNLKSVCIKGVNCDVESKSSKPVYSTNPADYKEEKCESKYDAFGNVVDKNCNKAPVVSGQDSNANQNDNQNQNGSQNSSKNKGSTYDAAPSACKKLADDNEGSVVTYSELLKAYLVSGIKGAEAPVKCS